ncbi:MAG: hypothetical protein ACOC1O_00485 [bacterium]
MDKKIRLSEESLFYNKLELLAMNRNNMSLSISLPSLKDGSLKLKKEIIIDNDVFIININSSTRETKNIIYRKKYIVDSEL